MGKVLFGASVYQHLNAFHKPFIKWFQTQGYEVHAVASESLGGKNEIESMGVICHDINFDRMPLSKKNIIAIKQLKELFKVHYFKLIHVHTPTAAFLIRYVAKMFNQGKVYYTAHGFHFFEGAPKSNWLFYFTAEKIAAKWTDHLITINEEDYKNAHKLLPTEKVSLVHGVGVEFVKESLTVEEKQHLKMQLGLAKDSIVISYIAEINENKNHQFLLRNWKKINQKNSKFELLLIGTGDKEQELKAFVEKEQLTDVHFLGFRRDVSTLLQITDIVTLLSHREGLPRSIMEAMVAEIPCVVTNTRGLRDLIQDSENGYVVNHEDDEKLVEVFIELGNSMQIRNRMGSRTKQLVEPFLLDNVVKEYTTIYEQLLW